MTTEPTDIGTPADWVAEGERRALRDWQRTRENRREHLHIGWGWCSLAAENRGFCPGGIVAPIWTHVADPYDGLPPGTLCDDCWLVHPEGVECW